MNPTLRRLLAKLVIRGECWEWGGAVFGNGYGQLSVAGTPSYTHRLTWECVSGPIPSGLCILHHCDNKLCFRPSHLFLGTKADNTADMWRKGRQRIPLGVENGCAKLDPRAVRDIRKLLAAGVSQTAAGKKYGVCAETVRAIRKGKTWKHVE